MRIFENLHKYSITNKNINNITFLDLEITKKN